MEISTGLPIWRRVYQTTSAFNKDTSNKVVNEILDLSRDDLVKGLLIYIPYTKESFDEFKPEDEISDAMKEFIHDLSQYINLDVRICYSVTCNYLMYDYNGKIKDFWKVTTIGHTKYLKENVWTFYVSERMFLLKTWRHLLEHSCLHDRLRIVYVTFLSGIRTNQLINNLIKQCEVLLHELSNISNLHVNKPALDTWVCRNTREQSEVVSLLTILAKQNELSVEQIVQLLKIFLQNNWGTTPTLHELKEYANEEDLKKSTLAQIGCFLVIVHNCFTSDLNGFLDSTEGKEITESLYNLRFNPELSILPLAWLVLRAFATKSVEEGEKIEEVLEREPFAILEKLITSKMFLNSKLGDFVYRAVHGILDQLCLMYPERKFLYERGHFVNVCALLCRDKALAGVISQARNGMDKIMDIAVNSFPYDFHSLTRFAENFLQVDSHREIMLELLTKLKTFLTDQAWRHSMDTEIALRRPVKAVHDSRLIVFPERSPIKCYSIHGRSLIQIKGQYNYFTYLKCLLQRVIDDAQEQTFDEHTVQKVIAGFKMIVDLVKVQSVNLEETGMLDLIVKVKDACLVCKKLPINYRMVKLYLTVFCKVMKYRGRLYWDLYSKPISDSFLPKLKPEYRESPPGELLFNLDIFEKNTFLKLIKEEASTEDHELAYLIVRFTNIIITQKLLHTIHLSAVAFLINFVFMQNQKWTFTNNHQKLVITYSILKTFHRILQEKPEEVETEKENIYELCHFAFLKSSPVLEVYFKLFIKDKYYLIYLMEREPNWDGGMYKDEFSCIHMQLAFLLLLINHISKVPDCQLAQQLPSIAKPIASYFTNSYNSVVSELSCRFLAKLAENAEVPLLGLLELDHYQVQSLFMERLRDPLVDESTKVAIMDFINICVLKQEGMTAAFFNLQCFMYWDGSEEDEVLPGASFCEFLNDYLKNVRRSHEYFKNPLQLGILNLLFNLWYSQKQPIIENIKKVEEFWNVMGDPFFHNFKLDVDVYLKILRIINLEVATNIDNLDPNLLPVLEKFLTNKEQLKKWIALLKKISETNKEEHVGLVNAWFELLTMLKNLKPEYFNDESKVLIINSSLDCINTPQGDGPLNMPMISVWCKIYTMCSAHWGVLSEQKNYVLDAVTIFAQKLATYYKRLSPEMKEILLCVINKSLANLVEYLRPRGTVLLTLLKPIGVMFDDEYECFITEVFTTDNEYEILRNLKPWFLFLTTADYILSIDSSKVVGPWFKYRAFVGKLMKSVRYFLKFEFTTQFAKLALDFLISYAQTPLSTDFLTVDFNKFQDGVKSPPLAVNLTDALMNGIPDTVKEWWLINILIIKLYRTILETVQNDFIPVCVTFVTENIALIQEIITLPKYTIDVIALNLVCETMKLLYILIVTLPNWGDADAETYKAMMDSMKVSLNASVLSILGYKKINFYRIRGKELQLVDNPPTELLVCVLNCLSEIVYRTCSSLKRNKPDIIKQMNTPHILENVNLAIETDFSVPRFELPIPSELTYGTLLCLADFLCKTLNQLTPPPETTKRRRSFSSMPVDDYPSVRKPVFLQEIFGQCSAFYDNCTAFMIYIQRSEDLPSEKFSALLHYDKSEFTGSPSSVISKLDYHVIKNSLESLMGFLALEIFYNQRNLTPEAAFSFKRELISEIQFFYEFIRKKSSEQPTSSTTSSKSSSSEESLGSGEITIKKSIFYRFEPRPPPPEPKKPTDLEIATQFATERPIEGDVHKITDFHFMMTISKFLSDVCQLTN